jgi:hypothetical protein
MDATGYLNELEPDGVEISVLVKDTDNPLIRIHRDALARAFNIIKEQIDALDPIDGVQSEAGRYGNTLTASDQGSQTGALIDG